MTRRSPEARRLCVPGLPQRAWALGPSGNKKMGVPGGLLWCVGQRGRLRAHVHVATVRLRGLGQVACPLWATPGGRCHVACFLGQQLLELHGGGDSGTPVWEPAGRPCSRCGRITGTALSPRNWPRGGRSETLRWTAVLGEKAPEPAGVAVKPTALLSDGKARCPSRRGRGSPARSQDAGADCEDTRSPDGALLSYRRGDGPVGDTATSSRLHAMWGRGDGEAGGPAPPCWTPREAGAPANSQGLFGAGTGAGWRESRPAGGGANGTSST